MELTGQGAIIVHFLVKIFLRAINDVLSGVLLHPFNLLSLLMKCCWWFIVSQISETLNIY